MMDPPRKREVYLEKNRVIGPSIYVLTFRAAPGDTFTFAPGQYITFYLSRGGKSITRSYSFFSRAGEVGSFDLLIKQLPGGYGSSLLCGISPASHLTFKALAPLGRFLLRGPDDRPIVLVATGTGLAPFIPMLEDLRGRIPRHPVWLVFGNRHREDLIYYDELRGLEITWPAFHFLPTLSRPPSDGSWHGATGHVEHVLEERFPDLANTDVYLCGVPAMVNQTQELALRLNCPKDHIFVERY
ncbi:MAG TPA: FAD-dependent oxidoreductase [Thermoplasmata archaeon]|nr:FAD-dependent oxidoreductase [Thermoplasmata archaeon]